MRVSFGLRSQVSPLSANTRWAALVRVLRIAGLPIALFRSSASTTHKDLPGLQTGDRNRFFLCVIARSLHLEAFSSTSPAGLNHSRVSKYVAYGTRLWISMLEMKISSPHIVIFLSHNDSDDSTLVLNTLLSFTSAVASVGNSLAPMGSRKVRVSWLVGSAWPRTRRVDQHFIRFQLALSAEITLESHVAEMSPPPSACVAPLWCVLNIERVLCQPTVAFPSNLASRHSSSTSCSIPCIQSNILISS